MGHNFWPMTHVTHQSIDPWPAWPVTRDPRLTTTHESWLPTIAVFQSAPLSGSALKIKHHHCHKILRRNNWIKLTLWLKLCRKSLQCPKKRNHGSTGHEYWPVTHVTHSDLLTHLTRDPWPADPLSSRLWCRSRMCGLVRHHCILVCP